MPYDESLLENLSSQEKKEVLKILKEFSKNGKSETYQNLIYNDYKEIPVDINTFISDPNYLGKGLINDEGKQTVFPYWVNTLNKIFPNNLDTNYNTAIFTGAIGLGKSTIAVIAVLYQLYRMMCLKDPYQHYGLQSIDLITFAFVNITLDAAKGVAWDKCQQLLQRSPWFMERGTLSGTTNVMWVPPKGIELIVGSQPRHFIGRALFSIFADEISFQPNQDIEKQKKKALAIVSSANARMQSRFMKGEVNPTLMLLASSKRTEQSFLESYIEDKKKTESKTTLIVDEPQWVIRTDKDSPNKFKVALGNKFLNSEVLPLNITDDDLQAYRDKGYQILDVPMGYYESFLMDIDIALTDIAGISTTNSTRYISGPRLAVCIKDTFKNAFIKDIIEVGNAPNDNTQYYDFFDIKSIDPILKARPLYIHLDMSISGDKTGIAGSWIMGKKPTTDGKSSNDLFYRIPFVVSIKAPKGYQISFEKNRNFIRWLRDQGFNIKGVSSDTFQSYDLQQQLKAEGFNCSVISVDRVDSDHICKPYQNFKSALYEERIELPKNSLLQEELLGLQRDANGKIDHDPSGINSKDSADAICLGSNTQIYLLDGSHKTIKELYDEKSNGTDNWVLAYNTETNNLEPVKISDVVNNGYKEELLKVYLDNGEEFTCTPDHKLLTRDGNYIEAQDSLNISLMPFDYESKVMFKNREYPYVYIPQEDGTNKGIYLHKLVCENLYKMERQLKEQTKNEKEYIVIHHKDCNRFNNNPENLEYLTNTEHSLKHVALNKSDKKRMQLSLMSKKLVAAAKHPFQLMSKQQRIEIGRNSVIKLNKSNKHRKAVSDNNKKLAAKGMLSFQINKEAAHTAEANTKRYNTCMQKYGEVGFKSSIIQERCKKSCLEHNGYDNPFHSIEKQKEMRLNKLKNAYNKILTEFDLTEKDYISLFDFKVYCYALHLTVSSKVQDIIECNLNIDVNNYNEQEYKSLRNKGNCIRLFLKDTSKEYFTYTEFLDYYNKKFNEHNSNFRFRFKDIPSYIDIVRLRFKVYNHRVIKIEKVAGDYVYDLKLDKIHNFAIMAGIFVHNCGSVWNASQDADQYAFDYGDTLETIVNVSNTRTIESDKKQLQIDLEEEITKMLDPMSKHLSKLETQENKNSKNSDSKPSNTFVDFGMGPAQVYKPAYLNQGIIYW